METTLKIGPSFTIEAEGRGRLCECPVWLVLWLVVLTAPFCRWYATVELLLPDGQFAAGVALYVAATVSLLLSVFVDPGTVPRNVAWRPPTESLLSQPSEACTPGGELSQITFHRGVELRHKFCSACGVYRPIRAVHCRMTDRCVEKWDHYCWYLGRLRVAPNI